METRSTNILQNSNLLTLGNPEETSLEVQDRGFSGPIKRTCVQQTYEKNFR